MRPLFIVTTVALMLLALLSALNLQELLRPTEINLGWRTLEAPLGLVMLGLAGLGLVLALLAAGMSGMGHARERKRLEQDLQAQKDLAEKAEGSRFAEIQRHLDLQAQASEHREREQMSQFERRLDLLRQALQRQLDDVGNSLAAYIGEVEDRLERRRLLRPPDDPNRSPYERH